MIDEGRVTTEISDRIGTITFYHPKSNSLPGALLIKIAEEITSLGKNDDVRVIVFRSEGEKVFCGGASFDEFKAIDNEVTGKEFFMGFTRVILAMKKCPKFIITRVQGKAVGGAVGVLSASDYNLAHKSASFKLSELALGIGPFIIAAAVEKRLGYGPYTALTIDTDWRDADWGKTHGFYADVFDTVEELDNAVDLLARKLSGFNPEGMANMKSIFWSGTDHWDDLLELRAEISGRLVLSEYTKNAIAAFDKK